MLKIKNLRGECQHCGGPIEFHAEHAGATAECPHCGRSTELFLATPPEEKSPVTRRAIIFLGLALVILAAGMIAIKVALTRAKRMQTQHRQTEPVPVKQAAPAEPFSAQQFRVSPVTLERGPGSSLLYAAGTISNVTVHQRFGVKVELELFDADAQKVGSASDYQKVIEPNSVWKFRAMVMEKSAATAKIVAIKEAQ